MAKKLSKAEFYVSVRKENGEETKKIKFDNLQKLLEYYNFLITRVYLPEFKGYAFKYQTGGTFGSLVFCSETPTYNDVTVEIHKRIFLSV